jgi:NOL1/NOP2/sun family putative RNA methylase
VKKIYPTDYIQIINDLLKDDAALFWNAQEGGPPAYGLRVNPLKTSLADLKKTLPGTIHTLPWSTLGISLQEIRDFGKHPYHTAGLYYLQEPSAMAPVAVLDPQPDERVLDLCAAPGGKSTQIHSKMGNTGLLIVNDPNPKRVQSLSRNLERWGARNTSVLCETPSRISEHLGDYFDRVLVDAPCSGEGRFRSDPGEIKKWSLEFSKRCCRIQDEILWFAAKMVKPGGVLVYSTCTFNQDENEGTIARFLGKNPGFYIDPIEPVDGYSQGIQLASAPAIDFSGAVRIWPHKTRGEGHFIARLRKSKTASSPAPCVGQVSIPPNPDYLKIYDRFFEKTLNSTPGTMNIHPESKGISIFGNRLYWIPRDMPSLEGLNVCHWGWWVGSFQAGKFIPSPALAFALIPEDAQKVLEFSLEDPSLSTYLRGSPLTGTNFERLPEGWTLVTCTGYSLGWGMVHQGRIKSYIPRWLRSNQ